MWEEWEAATTGNCKLSSLWYYINSYNLGYGNLHINVDGASIDQTLIKFAHWLCCSLNPFRLFRSVMILSGATGHTYDEYDQICHNMKDIMGDLDYWLGVDFLVQMFNDEKNKNQNFNGYHLKDFFNFETGLNAIYLPTRKWLDDTKEKYPFKVKLDKPMVMSFGETEVWNETSQQPEKITHPYKFYTFIDGEIKNKENVRKIQILDEEIDLDDIHWDLNLNENKLHPIPVNYQTKCDTCMTCKKYFDKHCDKKLVETLYNYYNNIPCKPPNKHQKERIDKNKTNAKLVRPAYYETVLNRRCAMKKIILKQATKKDLQTVKQTEREMKEIQKKNKEQLAKELVEEWKEVTEEIEIWTGTDCNDSQNDSESDMDAEDENMVFQIIRRGSNRNNNNNNNNNNDSNECMIDSSAYPNNYNFYRLHLPQLKDICNDHSIDFSERIKNPMILIGYIREHFQDNHW